MTGGGATQLLVGTESNGLLASCDQGETWARVGEGAVTGAVNQLHVAPAADGGLALYALTDDGVLHSDDLERSWRELIRVDGLPTAMLPLGDLLLLGLRGVGVLRLPRK